MKKFLFTIGMSAFLVGCIGHENTDTFYVDATGVPTENWNKDVVVVPPEDIITQPDEELEALKTFKDVPASSKAEVGSYMDWLARKLRKGLRSTGVQVKEVSGQIDLIVPNKVAFGTNQNKIRNDFEESLFVIANLLKEYDQTMVQVIGYTDNTNSVLMSKQISLQKAEAIASFLTEHGVTAERIFTDGAGEQNPLSTNMTSEGREKNRRVEITLISIQ